MSESISTSLSEYPSVSESMSESTSHSVSVSESTSVSESLSQSHSESLSISESTSTSVSESLSEGRMTSEVLSEAIGGTPELSSASVNKSSLGALPQTGEQDSSALGLLGIGLAGALGMFTRRKNRKTDN
ncbi:LPXTG cell wall anchor domain-containing protein [Lactococcus petauri]|uniref:LPXTG cell wall anchor domain-containing protein n=1 Tax=Lactococcus petauri TaxID=1940789 RepID=UPI0038518498